MGKKRTIYKKQEISFFIGKLLSILQNSATQQIIKWNDSQNGFQILNQTLLVQNLLPEHFKHHNLASFIRQLNLYGFHKVENTHEYYHEHFNKQQPEQFKLIKRIIKTKSKKHLNLANVKEEKTIPVFNGESIQKLTQQNLILKQENKELSKAKSDNLKILRRLKLCIKKSKKNMEENLANQKSMEGEQFNSFMKDCSQNQKSTQNNASDPSKSFQYSEEVVEQLVNSYLT